MVTVYSFSTRGTENSKVCEKAENTRRLDKNRIHSDRLSDISITEDVQTSSDFPSSLFLLQNPESLDSSIQSVLSALFPPFEATAPIVLCQLFRTIEERYHGDALQCLLDFLIPSKHVLESVQQAACVSRNHIFVSLWNLPYVKRLRGSNSVNCPSDKHYPANLRCCKRLFHCIEMINKNCDL